MSDEQESLSQEAQRVLSLLEEAAEPASDDPAAWTPPEVISLTLMYAYGVDALPRRGDASWSDVIHLCDDILFNRDLLQEWIDMFGEDAIEELIEQEIPDLPLPTEADVRLQTLYLENRDVREFIEGEYTQFRDDIKPPRNHRWWHLDGEVYQSQIH